MMDSVISWFSDLSNNMLPVFSKFSSLPPALDMPFYPPHIFAPSSGFSLFYSSKYATCVFEIMYELHHLRFVDMIVDDTENGRTYNKLDSINYTK